MVFLAQIRMASKSGLKKVTVNAATAEKKPEGNSIATAMEQYRKLVAESDSDDSDGSSDDDWSD